MGPVRTTSLSAFRRHPLSQDNPNTTPDLDQLHQLLAALPMLSTLHLGVIWFPDTLELSAIARSVSGRPRLSQLNFAGYSEMDDVFKSLVAADMLQDLSAFVWEPHPATVDQLEEANDVFDDILYALDGSSLKRLECRLWCY